MPVLTLPIALTLQLLFWMIVPLVLLGIILLGSYLLLLRERRCSWTGLLTTALPAMLKMIFVLYPIIANKAFEVCGFECE